MRSIMKTVTLVVAIVLASTVLMARVALAEDIQPPWWRGEWSTTSQVWEFNDPTIVPGVPVAPDGPAVGGQPPLASTQLVWTPGPAPWDHWYSEYMGRYGVVPLSGWLDVIVDNHDPKPENIKLIRVQITWIAQDAGEEPEIYNLDPLPAQGPTLVARFNLGGGWYEDTYDWSLDWNPPDESFTIGGTINVDELVIDTWCVPEPVTVGLMALGIGGVLLRRKRR